MFPKCGICKDQYSNETGNRVPKTLKCSHSLCSACAEKMVESFVIECPFCREKSDVPNNDVDTLQKNFGLLEVIETMNYSMGKKQEEIAVNSPPWCKVHSYNLAEFVCIKKDCESEDKLMCRTCEEFGVHKGHERGLLMEEGTKIRNKLNQVKEKLTIQMEKIENQMSELNSIKSTFTPSGMDYQNKVKIISLHFEKIHREIDEREEELLEEFRSKASTITYDLEKDLSYLEDDLEKTNENCGAIEHALNSRNADLFIKNPLDDIVVLEFEDTDEAPQSMADIEISLPSINWSD